MGFRKDGTQAFEKALVVKRGEEASAQKSSPSYKQNQRVELRPVERKYLVPRAHRWWSFDWTDVSGGALVEMLSRCNVRPSRISGLHYSSCEQLSDFVLQEFSLSGLANGQGVSNLVPLG